MLCLIPSCGVLLTSRSQAVFHNYINDVKNFVFTGAADVIMQRLSQAAEAVGNALTDSLKELARKVRTHEAFMSRMS